MSILKNLISTCYYHNKESKGVLTTEEACDLSDRLKLAISHARGGLDLAYECLEKKLYDEAMLHVGHHAARLHNLT